MTPTFSVIGIVVSDMATALAFYRRLGLDIPADADDQPHVEATVGGVRLAWDTEDTIRSFDPSWVAPARGGRINLAFACSTPAEVDATFATMIEAGAGSHLEPWDAFWGQRYASLTDPDGNGVDLFAPLPVSE